MRRIALVMACVSALGAQRLVAQDGEGVVQLHPPSELPARFSDDDSGDALFPGARDFADASSGRPESKSKSAGKGLKVPPAPAGAAGKDEKDAEEKTDEEKIAELEAAVKKLSESLELVSKNLRVTTSAEEFKLILGGAVTADFLWNKERPVGPGTPFFLTPGSAFGLSQDTFDAHARQTSLYAMFSGPKVCCDWETGGMVLVNLYDNSVIGDVYGLLPILAFGQIKNDDWRFAAGLQLDIFNPVNPTVLPFSLLAASGNTGVYRGQARIERFIKPSTDSQITLTFGVSDPLPTTINSAFRTLNEDNGKPNLEGRVAYGLGELEGEGLEAARPFEVGVSGVLGQIRTTNVVNGRRVVSDVEGWGVDGRWDVTKRFGVKGELFTGRTLGTYGTAGLANTNIVTFQGIHSRGAWGEVYYYWCRQPACGRALHTHVGYGIDDPTDSDMAPSQILRNETYWATTLWDVTKALRVGFEVAHRSTSYQTLLDNSGIGFQTQVQWKF
jgi:hypothetical protein